MLTRTVTQGVVSTSLQTNFHAFSIAFRNSDDLLGMASLSLLIQISSLRRNNNLLTSVINMAFSLRLRRSLASNVSYVRLFTMTLLTTKTWKRPFHQTRKPFYITPCRQKDPASRENYASALHQAMILRLSKMGRTSCEWMVSYGRVHFTSFQNVTFVCIKSWGKINFFLTTWTQLCRLCPQKNSVITGVTFFIH